MQRPSSTVYGFLPRNPAPCMLERLEWPLGRKPESRPQRIDLRSIRPVIHLAHRVTYPLVRPDRVIFDHEMVLVLRGHFSRAFFATHGVWPSQQRRQAAPTRR